MHSGLAGRTHVPGNPSIGGRTHLPSNPRGTTPPQRIKPVGGPASPRTSPQFVILERSRRTSRASGSHATTSPTVVPAKAGTQGQGAATPKPTSPAKPHHYPRPRGISSKYPRQSPTKTPCPQPTQNSPTAVEQYFTDLRNIRASGGSTPETVLLPTAHQLAQRRRRHAQTQGLLRQSDGATRRRPPRLRPLLGKTDTKRKAGPGPTPRTRCNRSQTLD